MRIYRQKHDDWISHRDTVQYKIRRKKLRDAWLILGGVLLLLPRPLAVILAMFAVFLSLAWLDETDYSQPDD